MGGMRGSGREGIYACCCCCCQVASVVSNSVRPHRRQPTRLRRPWDSSGKNTGVGCHFLIQCIKVKSETEVAQSCPTVRDHMDCSLPGSSAHGIFQARVLEWIAIAFSIYASVQFSSVQSLCRVWLFATPWTAACQASLSITKSRSLLKLMSIELVMPSSHLLLYRPLLLLPPVPHSIRDSFPMSQFFAWGSQSIGVSASTSVLPMNIQDWSPLGWTGWISLQSKGLSRVFSNTMVQKHQFFGAQLSSQSNSRIHTWPLEKP